MSKKDSNVSSCGMKNRHPVIAKIFVSKHGCHRQFLFQIGRFLKIFFPEIA
jgi:hypothetical protein